MSGHELRTITSQHESRISGLEKRQADHLSEAENGAPIHSPFRLEGPCDVITLFEEAVSLVRNDTRSTDLARGQGLISIAVKAAGILPLVEAANAQAEDWDKIRREQEVVAEIVRNNPKAGDAILEVIRLQVEVEELAEKRYRAQLMSESELRPVPEEKE